MLTSVELILMYTKKNITEESKKWATLSYVGFHVHGGVMCDRVKNCFVNYEHILDIYLLHLYIQLSD